MTDRRNFLIAGAAVAGAAAFGFALTAKGAEGDFPFVLSEAEWRERLDEMEFYVLREHGTERAFTSELDKLYAPGIYNCAGCAQPLYSSEVKYDSKTGWPSFWEALPGAIGTSSDTTFMMVRTECHCSNCGGHLGHIFDDGPDPTGKRHCINGVSLTFVAA
ncbi:peptide-methionine (R)-S-oxide reductase MsrB [Pelagibacterium sp.]|uniref:peptide-methionine (R)-S-oxide reductase MsrB n=1 Tax=Pelagibacterium sp. TaxID=1967288 RepID=UPI003A8E5632